MMLQVFQIIEATAEVARLADTAAVLVAARGRLLAGLGGNMTLQEARLAEYEVRGARDTCHTPGTKPDTSRGQHAGLRPGH